MPAALKTPRLEPDFAPDNWTTAHAAPASDAAVAVSAAPRRATAPARPAPSPRVGQRERAPERDATPPPVRSRPTTTPAPAKPFVRVAKRHRPLRLTFTAILCGAALMGQLVLLLWLHGKTLSSAREVEKLDLRITETSNQIERTQSRIADFDSSPQVKEWAAQKGWRAVEQSDFDDITRPEIARAQAQAAAAAVANESEAAAR